MTRRTRLPSARSAALSALVAIDLQKAFAPLALEARFKRSRLEPRDRALATELVYGVTRWRSRLDHVIAHFSNRPLARLSPWARNALRMAAYQAEFLSAIPAPVACDESVALIKAREPQAAGFVNAVCRAMVRGRDRVRFPDPKQDPAAFLAAHDSHPLWLASRWIQRLGFADAQALCRFNNEAAEVTLRVNAARTTVERVEKALQERGVAVERGRLSPAALRVRGGGSLDALPGFRAGEFQPQEESSQLVAWVVDPPADGVTADVCAGLGGKSAHLAEMIEASLRTESAVGQPFPRLWAYDVHERKLERLMQNARRLGVDARIAVRQSDARNLEGGPPEFDRILVDAPCSGTGTLRRRPDLRWRLDPKDLPALVQLQRAILTCAASKVKPGGAIVYSTCSLEAEENVENARWFLGAHPEFVPSPIKPFLPPLAAGNLPDDRFQLDGSALQLWPHKDGADGFFIFRALRK